jgi:D-alanyl-D-alanine carboxypeptidase/D-alanyl-D-alanine-endopeptidase (penicillin-binding protein 4)
VARRALSSIFFSLMSRVGIGALMAALAATGGTAIGIPATATAAGADASRGQPPLATSVLSVRRVPDWLAGTAAAQRLGATLQTVLAQSLTTGGVPSGCLLVTQGDSTVFASYPDAMLIPASNLKILTATAVLDRLGGSDKFVTSVRSASPPSGGVISGNLYLVGGGDPDLRTSSYGGGTGDDTTFTSLDKLAEQVRASGVTEVTGSIIGDAGRYDSQRIVPSWKPIYTTEGDVGPLSALEVNDGFVPNTTTTTAPPAPSSGAPPVAPKPSPTRPPSAPGETSNSAALAFAAATDPVQQAAQAFEVLLRQDGVRVDGGARSGSAPDGTALVTSIQSAPLADEVDAMLSVSDDTAAELFTKELGYQQFQRGTTAAGVAAIRQDLQDDGLPVSELVQVDGSGLDRGDRASCNLLVQALRRAGSTGTIAKGLPIAGKTGTLEYRMNRTPAQGRLIAKTGSLDNVVSLSGFVLPSSAKPPTPALGQPLVFSLILNGLPDTVAQAVSDKVGVALAGYPNLPPMKVLAPQAAG